MDADMNRLRELIANVRATFDPGGTLPADCGEWSLAHEFAMDALEGTIEARLHELTELHQSNLEQLMTQAIRIQELEFALATVPPPVPPSDFIEQLRQKARPWPMHGHSTCAADPLVVLWSDVEALAAATPAVLEPVYLDAYLESIQESIDAGCTLAQIRDSIGALRHRIARAAAEQPVPEPPTPEQASEQLKNFAEAFRKAFQKRAALDNHPGPW